MAYVYTYTRLDKNEIFYVGIGSDSKYKRAKNLSLKTDSKEGLEKIWYNEFNELVNKCQGGAQIGEVRRLKTMIQTKYNCIKE